MGNEYTEEEIQNKVEFLGKRFDELKLKLIELENKEDRSFSDEDRYGVWREDADFCIDTFKILIRSANRMFIRT